MTARAIAAIAAGLVLFGALGAAQASECPGNPSALGTSRIITIDPAQYSGIGTIQYPETLPLEDHEVVLTFDDGPLPPYTARILEILASECVKANYFIIGSMARGYPDLLRKVEMGGHVIGTHSENHPLKFNHMSQEAISTEVERGISSVIGVIGDPRSVAPFFRIPGLLRTDEVDALLKKRGLVSWSADVVGDDWKHIQASEVVRRVISRLEAKGKGIILLHDIQPATALALPNILRELKSKGYRIVQVKPATKSAPLVASVQPQAAPVPQPGPTATPASVEASAQAAVQASVQAPAPAPRLPQQPTLLVPRVEASVVPMAVAAPISAPPAPPAPPIAAANPAPPVESSVAAIEPIATVPATTSGRAVDSIARAHPAGSTHPAQPLVTLLKPSQSVGRAAKVLRHTHNTQLEGKSRSAAVVNLTQNGVY